MSLFDLTGHVGLVTGGNSGIGLGYAEGLAECGASVAIWGTNPKKNEAAVEQLSEYGVDVHAGLAERWFRQHLMPDVEARVAPRPT